MLVLCLDNDKIISSPQGDCEGNCLLGLTPHPPEAYSLIPPDSLWITSQHTLRYFIPTFALSF